MRCDIRLSIVFDHGASEMITIHMYAYLHVYIYLFIVEKVDCRSKAEASRSTESHIYQTYHV